MLSIILLFASFMFSQDHFIVEIEETGESTLFIFQDSISSLNVGDELGLFDTNGIINSEGDVGNVLVGSGVWQGSQLNVSTISSVNLTDFGGPILLARRAKIIPTKRA